MTKTVARRTYRAYPSAEFILIHLIFVFLVTYTYFDVRFLKFGFRPDVRTLTQWCFLFSLVDVYTHLHLILRWEMVVANRK